MLISEKKKKKSLISTTQLSRKMLGKEGHILLNLKRRKEIVNAQILMHTFSGHDQGTDKRLVQVESSDSEEKGGR